MKLNEYIEITNEDNMDLMKRYPDNYFTLCIIDPPYGIGEDGSKNHSRCKMAKSKNYKAFAGNDLKAPDKEFFNELFRISKNQIIFGANHFISKIPFDSSCWIIWDKDNGESDFADCELAWTSFNKNVEKFKFDPLAKGTYKGKIHPTQKPIELYEFCLKYADIKDNSSIIDSNLGSGSIALAVDRANRLDNMNLHLTACEIDLDYVNASIKRISENIKQGTFSF